jgi:hypothetical protein
MTARTLHAIEAAASRAEQAALAARSALAQATVLDPRMMQMLSPSDERRRRFDAASVAALKAQRVAEVAQERLVQMRKASEPKPDARLALKAAIAGAAKAERAIEHNHRAVERARERAGEAAQRFEEAQAGVARAKDIDAAGMARAARTGAAPAASVMRDARMSEQAAEDELMAARAGVQKLEQRQPDLEREHQVAMRNVEKLADAVIAAELPAGLVEEAAKMQAEFVHRRVILREILDAGLLDQPAKDAALALLREELPGAPDAVEFQDWQRHPAAIAFVEMRKRLATDADAVIAIE